MKDLLFNNIWSKKRFLNVVINLLVFLLAINFFHYGQLILPIISVIIFVDNGFKINIKNNRLFIILILFSIVFFISTYQKGFYSTMGFCLPMAYYIGSNSKSENDENSINLILLIAIGMVCHVLLNGIYEVLRFGLNEFLTKVNRYDVWTRNPIASTSTATNVIILFAIVYYLFFKEKRKSIKFITSVLFVFSLAYIIILRRRTPIIILLISFIICLFYDLFYIKEINRRRIAKFVVFISLSVFIVGLAYYLNFYGFRNYIVNSSLIEKFITNGLQSGRLEILKEGIKYMPIHLFGGEKISAITGNKFHDLLFDIYDYAGIVSFLLMIVVLILMAYKVICMVFNIKIDSNKKIMVLELFVGISLMLCVEPIMTGSSLFLIVAIMLYGVIEKI